MMPRLCGLYRIATAVVAGLAVAMSSGEWVRAQSEAPRAARKDSRIRIIRVEINERLLKDPELKPDLPRFGMEFFQGTLTTERFRQLIDIANAGVDSSNIPAAVVKSATYEGTVAGEVLQGTARLDIETEGANGSYVSLDGLRLALHHPQGQPTATWKDGSRANIGLGSNGQLVVAVGPSPLTLHWALQGERDASGRIRFEVGVPRANATTFDLRLPKTHNLEASGQTIVSPAQIEGDTHRRQVLLGGRSKAEFFVSPEQTQSPPRGVLLAREHVDYSFDVTGLQIRTQYDLEARGESVAAASLRIRLPPGIRLLSAALDGRAVDWVRPADSGDVTELALQLNEQFAPLARRRLVLSAVGETRLDTEFPLPRIAPADVVWQSGDARINWTGQLQMADIDVAGGAVEAISPGGASEQAEGMRIRFFDPSGAVSVRMAKRTPRLLVEPTYAWRLATDGATGRLSTRITCEDRGTNVLAADLAAGWTIDQRDVEVKGVANSAKEPKVYSARLTQSLDTPAPTDRPMQIVLDPPLLPGETVQLVVRAKREQSFRNQTLRLSQLEFIRFASARSGSIACAIATAVPQTVRVRGDTQLSFSSLDELDSQTSQWLSPEASVVVFSTAGDTAEIDVELVPGTRRLRASVEILARVDARGMKETYALECFPDAAGFDRVRVHFWPPRSSPLVWKFPDSGDELDVRATRIEVANDDGSDETPRAEVWEIAFPTRRVAPFRMEASRYTEASGSTATNVSLAAVQGATTQTGRCIIAGEKRLSLQIETEGMQPIAAASGVAASDVWGTFRFTPAATQPDHSARARISRRQAGESRHAKCWCLLVESKFGHNTTATHRATWLIDMDARPSAVVRLPADAEFHAAIVTGDIASTALREDGAISVELPSDQRTIRLSVDYSTPAHAFSPWQTISPAIPSIDMPVLKKRWRVVLPDGYVPLPGDPSVLQPPQPNTVRDHVRRLFGWRAGFDIRSQPLFDADVASVRAAEIDNDSDRNQSIRLLADMVTKDGTTWGQALLDFQFAPANQDLSSSSLLLLDTRALSQSGLRAESALTAVHGDSPTERLSQVLAEHDLALVVTSRYLLLTDSEFLRLHTGELALGPLGNLAFALGETIDRHIAAESLTAGWVTTPQIWASPLAHAPSPWQAKTSGLAPASASKMVYDLTIDDDAEGLTIYNVATFRALGLAAMLACFAVALWGRWAGMTFWISTSLIGSAVMLMLSHPWAWIVTGAVFGIALSWLCQVALLPKNFLSDRRSDGGLAARLIAPLRRPAIWLAVAVALAAALSPSLAAESEDVKFYPVWYRVDDAGHETGRVDLPKELLAELLRREAVAESPVIEWMIAKATYGVHLGWHATESTLDVQFVQFDYTIDVSEGARELRLPLPREGLVLAKEGVRFDDTPVEFEWRERHLVVPLPPRIKGEHRLRFRAHLPNGAGQDADFMRFQIPQISQSHLAVFTPSDAPVVEIAQSLGAVSVLTEQERARRTEANAVAPSAEANLGPVAELHLRWSNGGRTGESTDRLVTEEFYWLSFDEQGGRLEALLKVRGNSGDTGDRQIVLATDSDEVYSTGAIEVEGREGAAPAMRRRFRLAAFPAGDNTLNAKANFRLRGAAETGRLVLPEFTVPGAKQRRRWLAVTVSQGTQVTSPRGLTPQNPKTFLDRWGDTDGSPDYVFSWQPRGNSVAHLQFLPAKEKAKVHQRVRYGFARDRARIEFMATVLGVDRASPGLHPELIVPAGFIVESASVSAAETTPQSPAEAVAWWSQVKDQLHLFLNRPWDAGDQLVIRGIVPLAEQSTTTLPRIALRETSVESSQIQIYRQPDVLLDVNAGEAASEEVPEATWDTQWGRLCCAYQNEGDSYVGRQPQVRIEPNRPQLHAIQFARLTRSDAAWNMDVTFQLKVQGASSADPSHVVDRLEFLLPSELTSKLILEPPAEHVFLPSQDASQTRLLLIPPTAIADEYTVRMTFHDVVPPGRRVQPLDVRPIGINAERFVAVPRAVESQSVVWDKLNVQQVDEIVGLSGSEQGLHSHEILRVLKEPYRVSLRSLRRTTDVPLVRLADIQFAWNGKGRCSGLATYDLEPEGKTTCEINVPDNAQIVDVRVDGLPTACFQLTQRRWRVPLAGHNLPQRLEVFYEGKCATDSRHLTAYAPELSGITIERTAWSIWAPQWAGREASSTSEISALDLDVLRLRSLTELIRLPNHHRLEHSAVELRDWVDPWRERWNLCERQVSRKERVADAILGGGYTPADVTGLRYTFEETMREFGVAPADAVALPGGETTHRLWRMALPPDMRVSRRMHKGASQVQQVAFIPQTKNAWWSRISLALAFILAAGLLLLLPRWLAKTDWPVQSRHAIAVGVGILWALFLWPTILGWAVAVISAMLLVWQPGRLGYSPKGDELILRTPKSGG